MVNSMMNAHIYIVTNKINNKQYVGQTICSSNKRGHGTIITEAYRKYKMNNFTYQIIVSNITNKKMLNYLERFWIKALNTQAPNGYNIENGGSDCGKVSQITKEKLRQLNLGKKHTKETKEKLRQLNLGKNNAMYGKKHTEETKSKIGKKSLGRTHIVTEETKEKIRQTKIGSKNPMYGKPITDEHRAKLKANNARNKPWLGKKLSDAHKAHLTKEYVCPHCNKIGKGNAMIRHHMDNCKFKVVL